MHTLLKTNLAKIYYNTV